MQVNKIKSIIELEPRRLRDIEIKIAT
ncbi:uncharacterized protein METZ01_LOCUS250494 [marine metagenome]|uniref:Uncharacterized protein n=1 Tax=marine metagenome TaxID=408172 RepID=A0A382IDA5_9ZZZZ